MVADRHHYQNRTVSSTHKGRVSRGDRGDCGDCDDRGDRGDCGCGDCGDRDDCGNYGDHGDPGGGGRGDGGRGGGDDVAKLLSGECDTKGIGIGNGDHGFEANKMTHVNNNWYPDPEYQ